MNFRHIPDKTPEQMEEIHRRMERHRRDCLLIKHLRPGQWYRARVKDNIGRYNRNGHLKLKNSTIKLAGIEENFNVIVSTNPCTSVSRKMLKGMGHRFMPYWLENYELLVDWDE